MATRFKSSVPVGDSGLAARLRREIEGEVLFDPGSRGRYSTDASIYQIEPVGVVVPRTAEDIERVVAIAGDAGVPVLPRGAGTSQCGQTVGEALVVDVSKHLDRLIYLDEESMRAKVQPGIVLDHLNAMLKPHGLFFPVDVSPANRATIGGMTGNNSCGSRSIRYGNMVHNVHAINAVLADGTVAQFADVPGNLQGIAGGHRYVDLVQRLRAIGAREAAEIERRFPKLLRRVGGYNIDSIAADGHNMAHMLVGSEGTLGFFTEIELALAPLPAHKVLGICHFPTFYEAMSATAHIVELTPSAVELVDRTLMELARDIDMFRPTLEQAVKGDPDALLLVEFAGEDRSEQLASLARLEQLMADLGFPGAVVTATEPSFQSAVWEIRKAGLNIMMSMKGDGKPVSFVEDCAVRLEDLPEYTRRLDDIFARHGTSGTWYAHASVGTLHVRPIINLKDPAGAGQMRAIAEECFEMVREYRGSHSGEHGDGIVRSEFHEEMFGERLVRAFEEVKDAFDPGNRFNPGKIVRPERMDDREIMRFKPEYAPLPVTTGLDWSEWGGFDRAVEMCNNNGTCRKSAAGVMCPSYRVTRDEKHVTRGRANTLRLALTGQLGDGALTSSELYETFALCVGCKGCKRECPTGVDMARMKIEFLYHYHKRHPLRLKDRLVAYLPRYARYAARAPWLANARDSIPGLPTLTQAIAGFSARRSLPRWHSRPFRPTSAVGDASGPEVVLLADTFNTWFEPENARAAQRVLERAGFRVHFPGADDPSDRPLCCGRTFLAAGLVDEALDEARRTLAALGPFIERGVPIVGLEPSCLLTFRDETQVLLPGPDARRLAESAVLFEEFIAERARSGELALTFRALRQRRALVHGHCHQKAFGTMPAMMECLALVPDLDAEMVESSCCGMAGAFGYDADHYDVSVAMAEAALLPAVRAAPADTLIVAGGTSCRHQVQDLSGREPWHLARVLDAASSGPGAGARTAPPG